MERFFSALNFGSKTAPKNEVFTDEDKQEARWFINHRTYQLMTPLQKKLAYIIDNLDIFEGEYNRKVNGIRVDPYIQDNNIVVDNHNELGYGKYKHLVIVSLGKEYAYTITDEFTQFCKELTYNPSSELQNMFEIIKKHGVSEIWLVNPKSSGGKKAVVKHTVKQLQAIASKNNIKITKKVDGKTVRLNKQGLIAKLKRYKLL
jgi:hypothetical protein